MSRWSLRDFAIIGAAIRFLVPAGAKAQFPRRNDGPPGSAPASVVVGGDRYDVAITTPWTRNWLRAHAASGCAGDAWSNVDSGYVQIDVVPRADSMIECAAGRSALRILHGHIETTRDALPGISDPGTVTLARGGEVMEPRAFERVPAWVVVENERRPVAAHAVRLNIDPATFRPDYAGRWPALRITVPDALDSTTRYVVTLPDSIVARTWMDALPVAARVDAVPAEAIMLPSLVTLRARSPVADSLQRRYDAGDVHGATALAPAALAVGAWPDALDVRVRLALLLANAGDASDARELARMAHSIEPCLHLDSHASLGARALFEFEGPAAPCNASPGRAFRHGLLLPGSGDWSAGRHVSGAAFGVATLALAANSAVAFTHYKSRYSSYHQSTNDEQAAGLYAEAVAARNSARTSAAVMAGVWAFGALHAYWQERGRRHEQDRVASYGMAVAQ